MDKAPGPPPAGQPIASRDTRSTVVLWILALGGILFGLAGVAVAVIVAVLASRGDASESELPHAVPSEATSKPPAEPVAKAPQLADWQSKLFAKSCDTPCQGGSACPVTSDNAGTTNCPRGAELCSKCTSLITCIPGPAKAKLAPGETWMVHLSAILELGPGRRARNPCKAKRDLWLCLKSSSSSAWDCASQQDACKNAGGAAKGIAVTTEDLIEAGLDVQVRVGGKAGKVLAQRNGATYGSLGRAGLCRGFRMGFAGSRKVKQFTFFLMPPG